MSKKPVITAQLAERARIAEKRAEAAEDLCRKHENILGPQMEMEIDALKVENERLKAYAESIEWAKNERAEVAVQEVARLQKVIVDVTGNLAYAQKCQQAAEAVVARCGNSRFALEELDRVENALAVQRAKTKIAEAKLKRAEAVITCHYRIEDFEDKYMDSSNDISDETYRDTMDILRQNFRDALQRYEEGV